MVRLSLLRVVSKSGIEEGVKTVIEINSRTVIGIANEMGVSRSFPKTLLCKKKAPAPLPPAPKTPPTSRRDERARFPCHACIIKPGRLNEHLGTALAKSGDVRLSSYNTSGLAACDATQNFHRSPRRFRNYFGRRLHVSRASPGRADGRGSRRSLKL
ncbi:hypothetical protein EVAR_98359_1 [Eumeta japonica]|uniref:Uncharacterized protein n=1 Tax=Eumeta variegata TaxID=151549 RepID=A0A4C2AD13_EUMVA|nr:hypothetical protein EVAR_98359_1 [Eumeta japonica]